MSDYISRDEAYQRLHDAGGCGATEEWAKGYDDGITEAIRIINEMPAADVDPVVHGRWIECDYKHLEHGFIETDVNAGLCCSNCRTAFRKKKMTYKLYCPNCGAKMDESEESNNER